MTRLDPGRLRSRRLGERPGEIPSQLFIHGGRAPTRLSVLCFHPSGLEERDGLQPEELNALLERGLPLWVRVQGMGNQALIRSVLDRLGVPAHFQSPLLDLPQRPRVDSSGDMVLAVLHRLSFADTPDRLIGEQVGLLLLPTLLISIEEVPKPSSFPELTQWLSCLDPAPAKEDLDDILHFLIDELLDALFPLLEQLSELLEQLEEAALMRPKPTLLNRAYRARSTLREIRGQVWPLRHQIMVLVRQNQRLLGPDALHGFQDMEQRVGLIFEACELLRRQCDSVTEAYMASISNRMNQVMKTLTIVSTIFAPLTFIAGIYGMNFVNMPELQWRFGYAAVVMFMLLVAALQSYWLWRRGWFQDWTTGRR
ncbi:MAG: magnesium and cobalt transport protein CorA [Cyanobium sp.]|uniref:magnesium/cobalt transporter CorA n=1 Tax=Synechococcus sp. CS-1333 TaxID=2848638 RepID=UPI000DBBBFDC|nr:magnesium/cobalt transporter CorA [Synechococcus sp. CS-1333]MCT0211567.1 magnesium/cobalt transporter CorA [Synechococcus sp. CS-1333]PZV24640.1 MAG: magnesium and cobalt transport protein CorA [Cyanobium sp.]